MLSMASICSPTNFLIASYTRVNVMIFYCHSIIHSRGVGLLMSTVEASLTGKSNGFPHGHQNRHLRSSNVFCRLSSHVDRQIGENGRSVASR